MQGKAQAVSCFLQGVRSSRARQLVHNQQPGAIYLDSRSINLLQYLFQDSICLCTSGQTNVHRAVCKLDARLLGICCAGMCSIAPGIPRASCKFHAQDVVAHRGKLLIYKRPGQRVLINNDGFMQARLRQH